MAPVLVPYLQILLNGELRLYNMINEKIVEYRLEVCKKCPHLLFNFICKKCGCPIKRKVKNASADYCPDNRWKR